MQWEYYVKTGHLNQAELTALGEAEWELVTIIDDGPGWRFFFKRPLEDYEDEGE